jgi:hypothetical protein
LVNFLIVRLCNYDKSPDHVESGRFITLKRVAVLLIGFSKLCVFITGPLGVTICQCLNKCEWVSSDT